jgi:hypothetical protein
MPEAQQPWASSPAAGPMALPSPAQTPARAIVPAGVAAFFERRPETRPLAVIAAVLVILALIASAMVLWPAGSSSTSGGGSPEETIRGWTSAVAGGDFDTADAYLSDDMRSLEMSAFFSAVCGDLQTADVGTASIRGDSATVRVTLHMASRFGGGSATVTWLAELVRTGGGWKIDNAPDNTYCF